MPWRVLLSCLGERKHPNCKACSSLCPVGSDSKGTSCIDAERQGRGRWEVFYEPLRASRFLSGAFPGSGCTGEDLLESDRNARHFQLRGSGVRDQRSEIRARARAESPPGGGRWRCGAGGERVAWGRALGPAEAPPPARTSRRGPSARLTAPLSASVPQRTGRASRERWPS